MPLQPITVRLAEYRNGDDARALVSLLDAYASDPAGGGEPLSDFAKNHLPAAPLHHAVFRCAAKHPVDKTALCKFCLPT